MRAPADHEIHAPAFPPKLPWINAAMLRMDQQQGRPVLVEFWDFCRPNSIRTLPYLKAWHERYAASGLRVIGVHASGFPPSEHPDAVRAAVDRLRIPYPVVIDAEYEIWQLYGNLGWPARYLFDRRLTLFEYHYGEGGYVQTERAIQELLGVAQEPLQPLRPEDHPDADLVPQSEDVAGPFSGAYQAGGVWAVLDGEGRARAFGREHEVTHPGCYELISHPRSTDGEVDVTLDPGVQCHAVCFTPGVR